MLKGFIKALPTIKFHTEKRLDQLPKPKNGRPKKLKKQDWFRPGVDFIKVGRTAQS